MDCYDPYYAPDTEGVHFSVDVDGQLVQAYVGRQVLARVYAVNEAGPACLAAYVAHRASIDAAVRRRVLLQGPETVLVTAEELSS